ncbi:hypothetical protein DV452_004455 [Geotrichum candidum]|nr:hypothetical protein DV452_004455 [Geotrichum candidum]KAI8134773.1 hypothetical protein DUD61_001558 [Geotrichum candidum]KAI9210844.1 hypothetical protein DS838_004264 [Geotrichum bryndzae]
MDNVDTVTKEIEATTIVDDSPTQPELEAQQSESQAESEQDAGDKFDDNDFDDDFGDFDDFDDFQEQEDEPPAEPVSTTEEDQDITDSTQPSTQPAPARPKIQCLTETDFSSSVTIQATISSILSSTISTDSSNDDEAEPPVFNPEIPASYFNERSQSLWQQLALIQPQALATDWKKSTIRRLFMISLGVPLDLDEILPPTKTPKKLVLPNNSKSSLASASASASSRAATATSALPADTKPGDKGADSTLEANTAQNLSTWNHLAQVSELALQGMSTEEITQHIATLNVAVKQAAQTLKIWESKKAAAEKDKQDFESLIESLVDYAQKVGRKKSVKKK